MYAILLILHSVFRWLVLLSLVYTITRALNGVITKRNFSKNDNLLRHSTATIAHIQLAIGYVIYFKSPLVLFFRQHYNEASQQLNSMFFGMIHISLMTIAVIAITIGSSMAKRTPQHHKKFATMALWFIIAFLIIFIAIPWPFSPLAQRPLIRTF